MKIAEGAQWRDVDPREAEGEPLDGEGGMHSRWTCRV